MSEIKPGFKSPETKDGYSVLRDPPEQGWDFYPASEKLRHNIGNLSVVHCNQDGEVICDEEADVLMFKPVDNSDERAA